MLITGVLAGRRLNNFFAFFEDGIDGLSRTGIKAESAGLHAAGRIKFKGWG